MRELRQGFSSGFFIVFAFALLVFGSNNLSRVSEFRGHITDFFVPVMDITSRPVQMVDDFFGWTQQVAIVFSENKRLRKENERLRQMQIHATQLAIDNQSLRKLLNIGEGHVNTVAAARVVADGDSPFFRSVLINRGQSEGIRKGQAVINQTGIVGRIINVGASSARVLLATDINSRIPVKLATSGINMVLEGNNSSFPRLAFLPLGEEVSVGDLILTSGFGMVFPPDLPVGQVMEIDGEAIKIKLSSKLYNLNYVSIVAYDIIGAPPAIREPVILKNETPVVLKNKTPVVLKNKTPVVLKNKTKEQN